MAVYFHNIYRPTPIALSGQGGLGDMSLLRNTAGQNAAFVLISAATGAALTGATITAYISKDGGSQASTAGTFSELGNGAYNYAFTQSETNCNCLGLYVTAPNAVPFCIPFFINGLQKNVAGQNIPFCMTTVSGLSDASATVSPFVSKDGGAQAAGSGSVSNLGNGQYNYAATQADTNANFAQYVFTASGDSPQGIGVFTGNP